MNFLNQFTFNLLDSTYIQLINKSFIIVWLPSTNLNFVNNVIQFYEK